jgi:uncharacterized protein YndB with AHSA1/START domain
MLLCAGLVAAGARAETSQVTAAGFVSQFREEVSVAPDVVWKTVVQLPRWWNGTHSYSGDARNLTLDAQAGGCFCERWGDGHSVQHATVLMVQGGRVLRMSGAFGPLQDMAVAGVLTIVTSAQEGKTFLRMTYRVVGQPDSALDKVATAVDQVLGEQFRRLKTMAETGKPE